MLNKDSYFPYAQLFKDMLMVTDEMIMFTELPVG